MEYYVFQTKVDADTCIAYINGTNWFPIVGSVNGIPAPQNQNTTKWVESAKEMISGEWAIPRIPETRLDYLGVPQADRDAFIVAFGQDIRTLMDSDFPAVEI